MRDVLLPETDAGVVAQVVTAAVAYAMLGMAVRRIPELVWFVGGLGTLTFGFFALRTVH